MKEKGVIEVLGRKWDTTRPNLFAAEEGLSLHDIVVQSLSKAYEDKVYTKAQYELLVKYARVRHNGLEIDRKYWKLRFPVKGDRIEILHGVRGGGGGGGKNPLATILSALVVIAATIATFYIGGAGGAAAAGALTAGQMAGMAAVGIVSMAALYAINALFPAKAPSLGVDSKDSAAKDSPTYSISGGKNAHNINGYVPLILGKHRFTPPLGAKSWTYWHGDKQYFNMLVVWGHPDVDVSDFRIGDTALSKFTGVTHVFHQSTRGSGLKYFGWQYNEESVGATLTEKWVQRTVGEGTALSIDIVFPGGLTTINQKNGKKENRTVEIQIEYKPTSGGDWKAFPTRTEKKIDASDVTWTQADLQALVSVFYKDGKVEAVRRGQTVSGGIQLWPRPTITGNNSKTGMAYLTGCGVSCDQTSTKFTVTVGPGVFKYNNKTYTVGGGKVTTYWTYDYDEWSTWSVQQQRVTGKDTVLTIDSPLVVGINGSGKVVKSAGIARLWPTKASGVTGCDVSWKWVSQYDYNYGYDYDGYYSGYTRTTVLQAHVNAGNIAVATTSKATIRGAKQKQIVRNYQITDLAFKSWDVRIKRLTKITDDSYIIDECQWGTMRAIIQKPAFETPIPICVSELRIQATEQLSGYVTEFSALCHSKIPIYTAPVYQTNSKGQKVVKTAGHWNTVAKTSNPAAIMRYLLTSKHSLIKPFSAKRLDDSSLVSLYNWCKKNDFRFDYICDSEENLWARLIEVLAPARAAPSTDVDGLWGAIVDRPDKTVKQLFTPRNSWGMSIQRGFARLPDALRVSFIDETDGWTKKESFVYNDGYGKEQKKDKNGKVTVKKANDVVEWEFPGVTNWERIHKLGRYHLAQMLHRQMTITINTDWEWLAIHRGDLVGLASDVLMNTFGTARVLRKAYKLSGKVDDAGNAYIYEDNVKYIDSDSTLELFGIHESVPSGAKFVGIEIDDSVYFSEKGRYGIAVRSAKGVVNIIEIKSQYGFESSVLEFAEPSNAEKVAPNFGDLVSVSLLGSEFEKYLVASISPGDNMSAQITLVPYKTEEIMKAANSKIPAYSVPVILDAVKGAQDLPTPSLKSCVSDERVATVSASGAVIVCLGATWSLPPTTENLPYFTVQIMCTSKETGRDVTGTATNSEEYVVAQNVTVGNTYYCKVRVHDPATGRYSAWSNIVEHKVVGLVAPPPAPLNVKAVANYPDGVLIFWDEVQVIDLRRYLITGATKGQTKGKETEYSYAPRNQVGTLEYEVWSQDTTDHKSKTSGKASLKISAPLAPVWRPQDPSDNECTGARLENEGFVLTYTGRMGTWPIEEYEGSCVGKTARTADIRCVVPWNKIFKEGDTAKVRAKDVYGNWGAWSTEARVQVVRPLKPELTIGARDNGVAVFQWTDCRTYTDIKHYKLMGASEGSTTDLFLVLNVENILWETYTLTLSNGVYYANMAGTNYVATVDRNAKTVRVNGETYNLGAQVGNVFSFDAFRIGAITERIYAVDKYGFEGPTEQKTFKIKAPLNPILRVEPSAEGLVLAWQNCKTTFNIWRYIVKDWHWDEASNTFILDYTYEVDGMTQRLTPRKAGLYKFSVQAIDCIKNYSSEIEMEQEFEGVWMVDPKAVLDGSDILLTWPVPNTTWPIEWYIIYNTQGREVDRCKTTFYRFPAPVAGAYRYNVVGLDVAGNMGPVGSDAEIVIWAPLTPVIDPPVRSGENAAIHWSAGEDTTKNLLPVVAWDVDHWWDYDDDGTIRSATHDYGRLDVDTIEISASSTGVLYGMDTRVSELAVGTHYIYVKAIDTAGNQSPVGEAEFVVNAPGKVKFDNCSVVDNNVMLYWSEPDVVSLPIAYYIFEEIERYQGNGETIEYRAVIGRIDARFAASFETESGTYVYAITPVDVAGNVGTPTEIAMQVSQPPDFILYHTWDSLYSGGNPGSPGRNQPNGGRTNFIIDGDGHMFGPFSDATWQENLNAIAALKSVTASSIEWSDKIGWGFEYFSDPPELTAQYIEIVDVGTLIPSTTIQVTIDSVTLYGDPVFSCKIEVSADAENWILAAQDATMVYAGEFQYVRYTIGLTGGVVQINGINYKLDVKRKTDFGQVLAYGQDTELPNGEIAKANGPNYNANNPSSTPMEWGVWVSFNIEFSDVTSLPKPNVVNHPEYTAYTVFERVLNPTGFRVFVLDKNGQRVTATVDWSAFGV